MSADPSNLASAGLGFSAGEHTNKKLQPGYLATGRHACARALNIPQPSLCLDVAREDVGVGLWSRDVLAMTRL